MTLIALPPLAGLTQTEAIRRATIREILDSDQVFIESKPVKVNAQAQEPQTVSTSKARAGLLFNVDAGIRLNKDSSLQVGSKCIQLIQGEVLIAGNMGRNGCVGSLEVLPQGTVYIMRLQQKQAQVVVLQGRVEITSSESPGVKVSVGPGQGLTTTASGALPTTSSGQGAVETLSTNQLQTIAAPMITGFQVPLPDLNKVAVLKPQTEGFAPTFLREALVGREGTLEFDGQKGQASLTIQNPNTIPGVFTRTGTNTGFFTASPPASFSVPLTINFNTGTLTIGGTSGIANSFGLSGNNASGTVVLQNGQVIQLQVFGVNQREPPIPSTLPGTLTTGQIRDR